jgi:hypothetical protein
MTMGGMLVEVAIAVGFGHDRHQEQLHDKF